MKNINQIAVSCLFLVTGLGSNAQKTRVLNSLHPETKYTEFGCVPFKNGFVFASNKPGNAFVKYESPEGIPLLKLSYEDTVNKKQQLLPKPFNAGLNCGPVTFFDNYAQAVITQNIPGAEKAPLGLFFTKQTGNGWSEPVPFLYNNPSYSCAQASINEKGDAMVFVSNMSGGFGGTDLYISFFRNNSWTKPVNLGNKINSPANETFPFLHPSGNLYFSSGKQGGYGGLDVYLAKNKNFEYENGILLDTAINGAADDFAFWTSDDLTKGFFSSSRSGKDALYAFELKYPEFKDCKPLGEIINCYDFFEEATMEIKDLPLVYEWDFGDGAKQKKLSASHCFNNPGTYTINLNVLDTVLKKLYMNAATYELEVPDIRQPFVISKDTIKTNEIIDIAYEQGTFTDFDINNSFWLINNEWIEMPQVKRAFEKEGEYEIILGITSKLRQDGSFSKDCFSKKLLVSNADFAEKEVQAEIPKPLKKQENEVPEGTQPDYKLVLDESPSRKEINEENFSFFSSKVKEYYFHEDSLYRYLVGTSSNPLALKKLYDSAHLAGFTEAEVVKLPANVEVTSLYEVSAKKFNGISSSLLDSLTGRTFELAVINFDYNKWEVKPEGLPYLDTLVNYLNRHKSYTVEITAHTDNKGPDAFNKTLSERRAQSVFDYLYAKGIAGNRMIRIGYGEQHPKFPNTTEENMKRNRRVEFRILK